jgi:hypothetical protein
MALIFCSVILFTAWFGVPDALPHPEILKKTGYWGLALTVAGALFLVAVRLAGGMVASFLEGLFGMISAKLGQAVGNKIRAFRAGLDTMRAFSDFAVVTALSLAMWGMITLAYVEIIGAFVASPELAGLTLAKCMLLMASSMAVSSLQLPIIGWFTQIGAVEEVMRNFFGVAPEAAAACAATLLLVTFLGVAPVGLVWARFEHVSLRKVTEESGHAGEELALEEPPV